MKSKFIIPVVITVIVAGLVMIKVNGKVDDKNTSKPQVFSENSSEKSSYNSLSKTIGAVDTELVPELLEPGKNMQFRLSLNTHSVDLNYDFREVIYAKDDLGNEYKMLNWSGEEGGHHLSGNVEFDKLPEEAQKITIYIEGIDNQNAIFEWEL